MCAERLAKLSGWWSVALGVLRISDSANLAIHAMVHIAFAGAEKKQQVAEVAEKQDLSKSSLSKVIVRLARAGLLATRRGRHGGLVLGRPADKIMLLEIYEAIDGPLGKSRCLRGDYCRLTDCALNDLFELVQEEVRQALSSTRLSDLVSQVRTCGTEILARHDVRAVADVQAAFR